MVAVTGSSYSGPGGCAPAVQTRLTRATAGPRGRRAPAVSIAVADGWRPEHPP